MQETASAVPATARNRYHRENDRQASDCSHVTIHFRGPCRPNARITCERRGALPSRTSSGASRCWTAPKHLRASHDRLTDPFRWKFTWGTAQDLPLCADEVLLKLKPTVETRY